MASHLQKLLCAALLCSLPAAAETGKASPIAIGGTVGGEIAPGEAAAFQAAVQPGYYLLEVDQQRIDLLLSVSLPGYFGETTVDSPLDDVGSEFLLVRVEDAGLLTVRVSTRLRLGDRGGFELSLSSYEAEDPRTREAQLARTRAATHYRLGKANDLESAIREYSRAAAGWLALNRPSDAGRDLFCAAILHRLQGQPERTLAMSAEVLGLLRSTGQRHREADFLTHLGLIHQVGGELDLAETRFQQALEIRRLLGDDHGRSQVRSNLCLSSFYRGEFDRGITCYENLAAEAWFDRQGEVAAAVHTNVGRAHSVLGDPTRALEHYELALQIRRARANDMGEAKVLNNLALLHASLGEPSRALAYHSTALEIFRRLGASRWEGLSLYNISKSYSQLGEPEISLRLAEQAIPLLREASDLRTLAAALDGMGEAQLDLGEAALSLESALQALAVAREAGERRRESIVLRHLGESSIALGDFEDADRYLDEALEVARGIGDQGSQSAASRLQGALAYRRGDLQRAERLLRLSLEIDRRIQDRHGEVEARTTLAQVALDGGDLAAAAEGAKAALQLVESIRERISSPDLRSTYLASTREAHEVAVEVQMRQQAGRADTGHARQALAAAESGRARALLDLLTPIDSERQLAADDQLGRLRLSLLRKLSLLARRRSEAGGGETDIAGTRYGSRVTALVRELDDVETQIRERDSGGRLVSVTQPLGAAEMAALLDPDTTLLYYWIGNRRSFVWLLEGRSIQWFELPGREILQTTVDRAYTCLSSKQAAESACDSLFELGRILLGPIADRLGSRRLVIVADGALSYIPFAALRLPHRPETLLVEEFEVAYLPSGSVLAQLRARARERAPAQQWALAFGDPVFSIADRRFRSPEPGGGRPATGEGHAAWRRRTDDFASTLPRLRWTGEEVEAISSVDPDGTVSFVGYEATRENLLSSSPRDFRILHLATHAVVDAARPRFSGLVLTTRTAQGETIDGFLSLAEIRQLDLAADLVVLSACQTALGRQVSGEGLVGLTQAFLDAGASSVVATLWQIDDQATSAFMGHFYRLLKLGRTSTAALRQAQMLLRKESKWREPRFWAGFVLVGEWRAVNRPG